VDNIQTESVFFGTSGLVTSSPKKDFPPEYQDKSRLTYYASIVNSIEVNSSFYKIPLATTLKKWEENVPGNFRFTFKLWQGISHVKELNFKSEDVERFIQAIAGISTKKACLLLQFPPSLSAEYSGQLSRLLSAIRTADEKQEWKIAVEFRNRSWYNDNTRDLLGEYNSAMVIHDLPASATPFVDNSPFVYLRFHGPEGGYRGTYSESFLCEYAQYIQAWKEEGKVVYAYFNNTIGAALANVLTLKNFVEG